MESKQRKQKNYPNLIIPTHEQAVINGRKGAAKTNEIRKKRLTLKEELLALLSDEKIQDSICKALIENAQNGSIEAFKTVRDTIGEQPTQKSEVSAQMQIEKYFEDNPLKP